MVGSAAFAPTPGQALHNGPRVGLLTSARSGPRLAYPSNLVAGLIRGRAVRPDGSGGSNTGSHLRQMG